MTHGHQPKHQPEGRPTPPTGGSGVIPPSGHVDAARVLLIYEDHIARLQEEAGSWRHAAERLGAEKATLSARVDTLVIAMRNGRYAAIGGNAGRSTADLLRWGAKHFQVDEEESEAPDPTIFVERATMLDAADRMMREALLWAECAIPAEIGSASLSEWRKRAEAAEAQLAAQAALKNTDGVRYQYREIGEGEGWIDCSREAYEGFASDPHIDTRSVRPGLADDRTDARASALAAENIALRHALSRTRNVLGNMAMEHETGWRSVFARWPIHHEPLRSDARGLLPVIDAALAEFMGTDEEAVELFESERVSAALATYDYVLGDLEPDDPDREERIFDAMKAAIQKADHMARTGRTEARDGEGR